MYFFGPLSITFDGVAVGDTKGGVSLTLRGQRIITSAFGGGRILSSVEGATGVIHKFEADSVDIVKSLDINGPVQMVFEGINFKVTVNNAYYTVPEKYELGDLRHRSFDLLIEAFVDDTITSSNPLVKIENI